MRQVPNGKVRTMSSKKIGSTSNNADTRGGIHRIKVTLLGAGPPIWRRVEVPSSIPLEHLYEVIQMAFGWDNYHMWVFETGSAQYGIPDLRAGDRQRGGETAGPA